MNVLRPCTDYHSQTFHVISACEGRPVSVRVYTQNSRWPSLFILVALDLFLRDVFLRCWNDQRSSFCQFWWQFEQKQRLAKSLEAYEVLFQSQSPLAGKIGHDKLEPLPLRSWRVSKATLATTSGQFIANRVLGGKNCAVFLCRVAGATSAVLTSPLEVLKTRFQSSLGQVAMSRMSPVTNCGSVVVWHDSPVAGLQRYTAMGQYVK